jgi:hypothetical protein
VKICGFPVVVDPELKSGDLKFGSCGEYSGAAPHTVGVFVGGEYIGTYRPSLRYVRITAGGPQESDDMKTWYDMEEASGE